MDKPVRSKRRGDGFRVSYRPAGLELFHRQIKKSEDEEIQKGLGNKDDNREGSKWLCIFEKGKLTAVMKV